MSTKLSFEELVTMGGFYLKVDLDTVSHDFLVWSLGVLGLAQLPMLDEVAVRPGYWCRRRDASG